MCLLSSKKNRFVFHLAEIVDLFSHSKVNKNVFFPHCPVAEDKRFGHMDMQPGHLSAHRLLSCSEGRTRSAHQTPFFKVLSSRKLLCVSTQLNVHWGPQSMMYLKGKCEYKHTSLCRLYATLNPKSWEEYLSNVWSFQIKLDLRHSFVCNISLRQNCFFILKYNCFKMSHYVDEMWTNVVSNIIGDSSRHQRKTLGDWLFMQCL